MSATTFVTIVCDACGRRFESDRTTITGARGDAERAGWRVSYLAGGYHPTKRSNDPRRRDECRACRTDLPKPDPNIGVFAKEGPRPILFDDQGKWTGYQP